MSGIRSVGRRGFTVVPNWRWEDPALDSYDLRVAGWLASHADSYCEDHVTRNEIARKTAMSRTRASGSMSNLAQLGIISFELVESDTSGQRFMVTFDFDAWEGVDATRPGGGRQASGGVDATRPHREEQGLEQQGEQHRSTDGRYDEDPGFAVFWANYPRKVGKPRAFKAWRAARRSASANEISAGLEQWVDHWKAAGTRMRYIPHPTTWLNSEQWNDEPPSAKRPSKAMGTLEKMARGELG